MANYNPYVPQILGEEWVPIRDEDLVLDPFANTVERGYGFTLSSSTQVNNARFYVNTFPPLFVRNQAYTANIYPRGAEADSGPVRKVIIPCNYASATGAYITNPLSTPIAEVVYNSSANSYIRYDIGNSVENLSQYFFATNSYAQLLNGKRILGVNLLFEYDVGTAATADPNEWATTYTGWLIPWLANDGTIAQGSFNAGFVQYQALVTLQTPYLTRTLTRVRMGDADVAYGATNAGFSTAQDQISQWTYSELQRFERSAANRLFIALTSVPFADRGAQVLVSYVAMEVFYCEEKRVAFGSNNIMGLFAGQPNRRPFQLGMNQMVLRGPSGNTNPILPAGQYTLTLSLANTGDDFNVAYSPFETAKLNELRHLYEIPTVPGIQVNLPFPLNDEAIDTTLTKESTVLIPQLSLHGSGGAVISDIHPYGRQSVGQVWGSNFVTQDIDDSVIPSPTIWPYVRYYARRFGNTNGPLTLRGPYPSAGLLLPGTSGNYASTPDTAALDIVGDIDIRIDMTPDDWTPSATSALVSKWAGGGARSYLLNLTTTGLIELAWTTDGSTSIVRDSTASVPITTGRLSLRATLDVDNGAAGHTVTFYTGPTLDGPWTQLGAPVVTAGVTSIFSSATPVEVGSHTGGTSSLWSGYAHGARIYNGIAGTAVATPNFDIQPPGTTSFVDSAGRTWTINGTAAIVRGDNVNNGVVTITPTEFDALEEIVDGWKEVTLQFSTPPSMGTSVTPPVWTWVAPGVAAGERWEVLGAAAPAVSGIAQQMTPNLQFGQVPTAQRLYAATYGAPVSGAAINEEWLPQLGPYVSGAAVDPSADAVIMFSQSMPLVTGFSVAVTSQALTGIGLQCGIAPCGVPTALLYNQLSWGLPVNTGTAYDLFNRVVSGGWGTATDGKVWQNTTGAENSVDGTYGIYTVASGGDREGWVNVGGPDQDVTVTVRVDGALPPATFRHRIGIVARLTDNNNHYNAEMWYQSTGAVELWIRKRVAGTQTDLASVQIQTLGESPTAERKLRFEVSGTTLRAKLWSAYQDEPSWWQLQATDASLTTGNNAGVFVRNDVSGNPSTRYMFRDFQVGPPRTWFGYYELQRSDSITDWQTIMKATSPAVTGFKDFEARTDMVSNYRIRAVNNYGFVGSWSSTVNVFLMSPGVSGGCFNNGEHVMMFTSNERQDGGVNLAYSDIWESEVTEDFAFAEASFVQMQPMFERDFFTAFRPSERGGDQFSRALLVNAAAISPATLPGFNSLSDMAWADVSYICVRDEEGNRWFASVNVPGGTVKNRRKLYMATINIIEVTDTPSPVDP